MEKLLRKLKLIDQFAIVLKTDRNRFIQNRRNEVAPETNNPLNPLIEGYSFNSNGYIGSVSPTGFSIRRRKRIFHIAQLVPAIAIGDFIQPDENTLKIETEVNGFKGNMLIVAAISLLMYLLLAGAMISSDHSRWDFLLGLTLIFSIPMIISYCILRFAVVRMKRMLQKDFEEMAK